MILRLRPILRQLRSHAAVFEGLCRDVPKAQACWKPAPDQWSILEVMNHMADEEIGDFRTRVDLTLHHPGAAWPSIDPPAWAVDRKYNETDLSETVSRFLALRSDSVAWLEGLTDADWDLAYQHPALGVVPAGRVMTSWLAHDHIHIRQINRLHREYLVSELSEYSPDYAGDW